MYHVEYSDKVQIHWIEFAVVPNWPEAFASAQALLAAGFMVRIVRV